MAEDRTTEIDRRSFCVAPLGMLLLPGCSAKEPLRITAHPWPGYDLVKLGIADAKLKRRDLQWDTVETVQESFEQLSSGRSHGACLTLDQMLLARSQGIPLRAYLIFDISAGADTVLARPELNGLHSLKGATIGVESSSLGAIMLTKLLEAAEISKADVTVVSIDENHYDAWAKSDLDFIITYEPSLGRLRRLGLKPVFDSRRIPRTIVDLLAIRPEVAVENGSAIEWIVSMHFSMLEELRTNPMDVYSRLSTMTASSPEEVAISFRGLDFPDRLYNRKLLSAPAVELTQVADGLSSLLIDTGVISHRPDLKDLFSPRYLPKFGL